jgi:hypothetical protein
MNLNLKMSNGKAAADDIVSSADDIKQQLGEQLDQLVQTAGKVGKDVAAQATDAKQDVLPKAAAIVSEVPTAFDKLREQALGGLNRLGRETRSVRVIRVDPDAPTPTITRGQSGLMTGIALLFGMTVGLALAYFLDPAEGQRRRRLMREQFSSWGSAGRQKASAIADQTRTAVAAQTKKVGGQLDELADADSTIPSSSAEGDLQPVGPGANQPTDDGFNAFSTEPVDEQVPSEIH